MKRIRIELSDSQRSCAVDPGELHTWSKALLDDILFEAAQRVSEQREVGAVTAVINFRVRLDDDGASIILER